MSTPLSLPLPPPPLRYQVNSEGRGPKDLSSTNSQGLGPSTLIFLCLGSLVVLGCLLRNSQGRDPSTRRGNCPRSHFT